MNELLEILKEAMPKVDWEKGEDLVDDGNNHLRDHRRLRYRDSIRRDGAGEL